MLEYTYLLLKYMKIALLLILYTYLDSHHVSTQ